MADQTRRSLMSALPLAAAGVTGKGNERDKGDAQLLLRYLAYDRLDRLLAEEERELRAVLLKISEENTEVEDRLRAIPDARADKAQALADPRLSADGLQYLREESTNLALEESTLNARLPQIKTQQAEINQRLIQLHQRREKLASELTSIERLFDIKLPQ